MIKKIFTSQKHLIVFLSLCAALIFVFLASISLEGQGLYYDELHQAPAAFYYLDENPPYFSFFKIKGVPVLNMFYSGAIKSTVYGLYLKITKSEFSVINWRLLGIFSSAFGIFLFGLLARKRLTLSFLLPFLFLFVTDSTVLLTSRHDWGPTAIALSLRLIMIAFWFRASPVSDSNNRNIFWVGVFTSLSVFEKLSSVVLLFPVLILVYFDKKLHVVKEIRSLTLGFFLGSIPLICVNLYSYLKEGYLVSLLSHGKSHSFEWIELVKHYCYYLTQGDGVAVGKFILGSEKPYFQVTPEFLFMGCLFSLIFFTSLFYVKKSHELKQVFVFCLCFLMTGFAIYLLPKSSMHHWIIVTPFQYVAIAYFFLAMRKQPQLISSKLKLAFFVLLSCLCVSRLIGVGLLEMKFIKGQTSPRWDLSLTQIGEYAKENQEDSLFVVLEWGIAVQIYCFVNGRKNVVEEIYKEYLSPEEVSKMIRSSDKENIYFLRMNPPTEIKSDVVDRMWQEVDLIALDLRDFSEVPLNSFLSSLSVLSIRHFKQTSR